jgi:electron transport complex protein RnfB
METVTAIGFLLSLASALAIVLAVANAKLKVYEDPRIDHVSDMLPNTNCGACGEAGCRAFSEALVAGRKSPSACTVGGEETALDIAEYLGVDAGEAIKRVARLHCAGGSNVAIQMSEYQGHESCRSAAAVGGGSKGCRYGCLGFGDCFDVCDFDAIRTNSYGIPVVDAVKCTACGDCVDICPKDLFELLPIEQKLLVQCKSELDGDEMLDLCKVACTACARCVADAPQGLLKMKKNLPAFNAELQQLQSPEATLRCPTGAIEWVEGGQFRAGSQADVGAISMDVY